MRAVPGYPAGSVFGFPFFVEATAIYLGPWVALIALMQSSSHDLVRSLAFIVIVIGSVLTHELAHAFMARALGVPVRHIALTWFGGYASFWVEPTRWRSAAIAFAGPAANLAIGAAFFIATKDLPDPNVLELSISPGGGLHGDLVASRPRELLIFEQAARDIALVNLSLGFFNLLPGYPLDGGHILRSVLSTQMSWGRAGWIAAWIGIVLAAIAVAYGIWVESFTFFFLGIFVGVNAWMERQALRYD